MAFAIDFLYHYRHTGARGNRKNFWRKDPAAVSVPAPEGDRGVYGISVAADLVGMGVQNLRLYEARGLLEPERTDGGTRRYSANDLDRLRRIGDLLHAGLNLAGIGMVLELEGENAQLRQGLAAPAWPATMGTSSAPRSRKPTSSNKNSSKPIPR